MEDVNSYTEENNTNEDVKTNIEVVEEEYNSDNVVKNDVKNEDNTNVKVENSQTSEDTTGYSLYVQKLNDTSYSIIENKLCCSFSKGPVAIANFLPIVKEQITFDNDKETEISYIVGGFLLETKEALPDIHVSKQEYENFGFVTSAWKMKAIIFAGSHRERVKEVSQLISQDTIKQTTIYGCTGMKRKNGKLNFLYHNGVIGKNANIKVDLSTDKLEQYSFTNKSFDLKEALKTSYSILDITSKNITIPLMAVTYLSPINSLLRERDIYSDFIVWTEGKTGSYKSTLSALMLSHFGKFREDSFVMSFRDSLNSLEKKSFTLKDTLHVIDDYNPETVGTKKLEIAEKIFAMYGDRVGRDRLSQNGKSLKSPYTSRGLCIVTGECFPNVAQSRYARCLIVDMYKSEVNLEKVSIIQENIEHLSFAMKNYIEWVIENEKAILDEAESTYNALMKKSNRLLHGRLNVIVAVLYIGFYNFTRYLLLNGIITEEELNNLCSEAFSILSNTALKQMIDINNVDPIVLLQNALEQLNLTNSVYVTDALSFDERIFPGTQIGYLDTDNGDYWFIPDILYKEIVRFYNSQGMKFPVSKASLWKYLDNAGMLKTTPNSDRRTIRHLIPSKGNTKVSSAFIVIPMDKLSPDFNIEPPSIYKGVYNVV